MGMGQVWTRRGQGARANGEGAGGRYSRIRNIQSIGMYAIFALGENGSFSVNMAPRSKA
jgi:hypothetical protein